MGISGSPEGYINRGDAILEITNTVEQLLRDEEERLFPYDDATGKRLFGPREPVKGNVTIGVGHKISPGSPIPYEGITREESDQMLAVDVDIAEHALAHALPWTASLDDARRGVLVNMAFNMGINGLLGFHRTLTAIEDGKYKIAAGFMLQSKWAGEVGARAERLANQMAEGVWQ